MIAMACIYNHVQRAGTPHGPAWGRASVPGRPMLGILHRDPQEDWDSRDRRLHLIDTCGDRDVVGNVPGREHHRPGSPGDRDDRGLADYPEFSGKRRVEPASHGFGYEIKDLEGVSSALVCGGMGRERNLIIDDRLTDFTPVTNIKGQVNREGVRKMTPREWARLQGFPDDFELPLSDTHLYKQLGNSVTVPVIEAIAKEVRIILDANDENLIRKINSDPLHTTMRVRRNCVCRLWQSYRRTLYVTLGKH